jgi:predicted  nucleic acid-binding Zn-ribbon protein
MELNKDIRDRILTAADALYEQAGRASFPTVDSVRKVAKVNMNDAAATMKEWRRAQTAQAAPVAITVPEAVHQLHSQALAALWQSAQNTANESLRAAQAGWEAERAEADTINKQLGDAYDAQAVELDAANRRIDELTAKYQAEQQRTTELAQQIEETRKATLVAENRAAIAEQRAVEIERRAADLRTELDLAHQDAVQTRTELADVRQAQQEQRKTAAQEALRAAERLTATQAERDEARKEAAKAREETAHWRGQVEALKEQQMGFLEAIKTGKKPSRAGE